MTAAGLPASPLPRPSQAGAAVIGGGTMGADVALVLARAGCRTVVVEPTPARRDVLAGHFSRGLEALGAVHRRDQLSSCDCLDDVDWPRIDLVVECIPEQLAPKQALFADLVRRARPDALLTSNSSSFPISAIGRGLPGAARMLGLHFFMPAHLVPLVEVVLGVGDAPAADAPASDAAPGDDTNAGGSTRSDPALGAALCDFMRGCGLVPVLVKRDLPGFLANRLQHALAREAFALIDAGVASAEDVDAAVRFGFGFRFLAAGPVLQRDHAGIDVHCAAAATMYPSLAVNAEPSRLLRERVAAGRLGMKSGGGFYDWPPEAIAAERHRYDALLQAGLRLLADDLPPVDDGV
jgi:3-hydroxybutyryl-CoA dehydrogenase